MRVFPNQKPWFNGDIKQNIRIRREAFKSGGQEEYKRARYDLERSITAAKRAHSKKLESLYLNNNTRSMWKGIQAATNYRTTMTTPDTRDATLPDSLNNFYARFDRLNTDTPSKAPCDSMDTAFQITHAQVLRALKQVKPHKEQLVGVYADIFNLSLSQAIVPRVFKSSIIIPVPKKPNSSTLNRVRPIRCISGRWR